MQRASPVKYALCMTVVGATVAMVPGLAAAEIGNAWHIPEAGEPQIASMRSPVRAISTAASITIFSGNQFQGTAGTPGNQLQAGSAVFVRRAGSSTWTEAALVFHSQAGNNKYFSATVTAGAAGEVYEYYLRIAYSNRDTTYVYGTDSQSFATASEAVAQASPFSFTVRPALAPSGDAKAVTVGDHEARVYSETGHVAISGPGGELAVAPAAVRIGGRWRLVGRVLSSRAIDRGIELTQELGSGQIVAQLELGDDGVARYEVTDWRGIVPEAVEVSGATDTGERFYGLGEKFNAVDQSGKLVRMLARDAPGNKGDQSYKVAPWFVTSRGRGFYFDSTAESVFDLRATADDRFVVSQEYPLLSFALIAEATPVAALERYTAITGRPPLPAPWVFAPWLSSDIWRNGGEVRHVIGKYRELGIPGSVFVFDSPWEVAYNDFVWNMAQWSAGGTYEGTAYDGFATLTDMMEFLRENGFQVVVWLTPFINTASNDEGIPGQNTGRASNYDEAASNGYFVRSSAGGPPLSVEWWKGTGSPIDFTNPAARAWFQDRLRALVTESGGVIGGFKADDGESDFIPLGARYFDGRSGIEMKNGFSVEYHAAIYDVLGPDGVLFSRSGFAGTQAFPAYWAGDNEPNFGRDNGLASVIIAGLSSAMSGYSIWGHDIGGYQETNQSTTPANLFMRWTQFGALSPIMQIHRQVGSGMHYPWSYGEEALANYRDWAKLHTALFPYLYTFAKQSAERGLPILRPLPLVYPTDPGSLDADLQYLFGSELLVAPIVANEATTADVTLPPGVWYDWFTGQRYDGGQVIQWSNADQSRMPLYARGGAIVPMLRDAADSLVDGSYGATVATPTDALDVRIYAEGTSSFDLYDGTSIESERTDAASRVTWSGGARPVTLRVFGTEPLRVERDGGELERRDSLAAGDVGWALDGQFVLVQFEHSAGDTAIDIIYSDTGKPPGHAGSCACGSTGAGGPLGSGAMLLLVAACSRRRKR